MLGTSPKSVATELHTELSNGCQGAVSGSLPSGRRALHRCAEIQHWSTGNSGTVGLKYKYLAQRVQSTYMVQSMVSVVVISLIRFG